MGERRHLPEETGVKKGQGMQELIVGSDTVYANTLLLGRVFRQLLHVCQVSAFFLRRVARRFS